MSPARPLLARGRSRGWVHEANGSTEGRTDELKRVEGLYLDEEDHRQTRELVLGNIDMLLSVYDYYVQLGNDAALPVSGGEGVGRFEKVKPKRINMQVLGCAATASPQASPL